MNEPDTFIVTVETLDESFSCDMELPANLQASELGMKLLEIFRTIRDLKDPDRDAHDYDVSQELSPLMQSLRKTFQELDGEITGWNACIMMFGNRILQDSDTLMNVGAFDGSRIVLLEA